MSRLACTLTLALGIGAAGCAGCAGGPPPPGAEARKPQEDPEPASEPVDDGDQAQIAPSDDRPVPWEPPQEPILDGLDGAAQLLADGQPTQALERIGACPVLPTDFGEKKKYSKEQKRALLEPFVRTRLISGRAHRQIGSAREAVHVLEPLRSVKEKDLETVIPPELVYYELARARLEMVRNEGLGGPEGDEQREAAADELADALGRRINRHTAAMRVTYSRALAGVEGGVEGEDDKSRARAARKAKKSLEKSMRLYPNYPQIAELELLHAQAVERTNKLSDAASEYRSLFIRRQGDAAADAAWDHYERLCESSDRITCRELSVDERIEAAMTARGARWVERSRSILDGLLDDDSIHSYQRRNALRSRAYTAYKQRDYDTCVEDLRTVYEDVKSLDVRHDLSRCLRRGERYEEAVELWHEASKGKGKSGRSLRASALFRAADTAFEGGMYQRSWDLLDEFDDEFRGFGGRRRFLRAYLAYRLGKDEEAKPLLESLERDSSYSTMARYFSAKVSLRSESAEVREEGRLAMEAIIEDDPLSYYGLQARQRLLDGGFEPPAVEPIEPVPEEATVVGYAAASEVWRSLDEEFGDAFVSLRRGAQLHGVGWLEESRRELRVSADEYLNGRTRMTGGSFHVPRNEDIEANLSWREEWDYIKPSPGSAGRKVLRDEEARERLRSGLRRLSVGLQEPLRFIKLCDSSLPYKARWQPRAYRATVEREAYERNLDPFHMWALMYTESRFRRHVVSYVGARGALQIMPWTGRQLVERLGESPHDFDPDILFDISENARLSAYYVSELFFKFHNQAPMAYASYNGGPSNVGRWVRQKSSQVPLSVDEFVEEVEFDETRRYTRRVMEIEAVYELLYKGELPRWDNSVDPNVEDNIGF